MKESTMSAMFVWGKSFKHHVFDNNIMVKENTMETMLVSKLFGSIMWRNTPKALMLSVHKREGNI